MPLASLQPAQNRPALCPPALPPCSCFYLGKMRNETYELCRKDKKDVNMTVGDLEAVLGADLQAGMPASDASAVHLPPTKPMPARLLPPLLRCRCRSWPPAASCSAWWMPSAAAQTRWVAVPGLCSWQPLVQPCVGPASCVYSVTTVSIDIAPPCLACCSGGSGRWPPRPSWQATVLPTSPRSPSGSRCRQGSSGGGLPRHQDQEGSGGLRPADQD